MSLASSWLILVKIQLQPGLEQPAVSEKYRHGQKVLVDVKTAVAGIIGANGAGKSTLFRMLVGQEQPDGGSLKVGETVKTMYVDQSRESLASERYLVWLSPLP